MPLLWILPISSETTKGVTTSRNTRPIVSQKVQPAGRHRVRLPQDSDFGMGRNRIHLFGLHSVATPWGRTRTPTPQGFIGSERHSWSSRGARTASPSSMTFNPMRPSSPSARRVGRRRREKGLTAYPRTNHHRGGDRRQRAVHRPEEWSSKPSKGKTVATFGSRVTKESWLIHEGDYSHSGLVSGSAQGSKVHPMAEVKRLTNPAKPMEKVERFIERTIFPRKRIKYKSDFGKVRKIASVNHPCANKEFILTRFGFHDYVTRLTARISPIFHVNLIVVLLFNPKKMVFPKEQKHF